MLDERWENVAVLPETQKMHSMNVFGVNAVEYGKYALRDEWNVHKFRRDSEEEPIAQEQGIAKKTLIETGLRWNTTGEDTQVKWYS